MTAFVLVIVMAVLVEALIEYGKTIGKALEGGAYKTAVTQLCAVAMAVFLCFAVNADIFMALGINFNVSWLGCLLTGIFASRGSNYVSDLTKKLQGTLGGKIAE